MKLVIKTDESVAVPMDNPDIARVLGSVNPVVISEPFNIEGQRYHYLQISKHADVDRLIQRLMEIPVVQAAFEKGEDLPPI